MYASNVKVRAADDVFYYPDVMMACGPEDEDDDPLFEEDPCLLVEVVSPSTSAIDRREKLLAYKRLPGLKAYLIVEQETRRVERHGRDHEGLWWQAELSDGGTLPLLCPETSLTLAEIYEGLYSPVFAPLYSGEERRTMRQRPGKTHQTSKVWGPAHSTHHTTKPYCCPAPGN